MLVNNWNLWITCIICNFQQYNRLWFMAERVSKTRSTFRAIFTIPGIFRNIQSVIRRSAWETEEYRRCKHSVFPLVFSLFIYCFVMGFVGFLTSGSESFKGFMCRWVFQSWHLEEGQKKNLWICQVKGPLHTVANLRLRC